MRLIGTKSVWIQFTNYNRVNGAISSSLFVNESRMMEIIVVQIRLNCPIILLIIVGLVQTNSVN